MSQKTMTMTQSMKKQSPADGSSSYLVPPPSYEDATTDDNLSDYTTEDDSLDRVYSGIPHDPATRDRLHLPVVIPQTTTTSKGRFTSPFMRAWVPELQAHGLQKEDFVTLIEGINECVIPHPVFSGLNIAGNVMQLAGQAFQPVQYAGMGLSTAATAAGGATSYYRTREYVKTVNESYFHPAGLHLHVLNTEKMTAKVGYPQDRVQLPPLNYETDLTSTEGVDSKEAAKIAAANMIQQNDPRLRRIQALEGYVMPLDMNVPAPTEPTNLLKKMSAAQAAKTERKHQRKMEKSQKRALRKKDKTERRKSKADDRLERLETQLEVTELELEKRKSASSLGPNESLVRLEKERAELTRKIEKRQGRVERRALKAESRQPKREKKVEKRERKEEKTVNKIKWLVIVKRGEGENSDEDSWPESDGEMGPQEGKGDQ